MPRPLALVLASDGVWDNWTFPDLAAHVLADRLVDNVALSGSALGATIDLMNANLDRGRANFGNSADNMTAVVLYLFPREG